MAYKIGKKEKPMVLNTPPLTSDYTMHLEEKDGKVRWIGVITELRLDFILASEHIMSALLLYNFCTKNRIKA